MKFKKGQSGNPQGNGLHKPLTDALRYIGNQPFTPKKRIGLPKKPTVWQAAARSMLQEIINGNAAAFNPVADRVEGKVALPIGGAGADLPPVQTQDTTLKEVARIVGFLLLSQTSNPEGGTKTPKSKAP